MKEINIKVEPLMEDDYKWIEATLDKYKQEESIQTAFDLDGFLTALVISPQVIPPHVWLPFIFNDTDGAKWEDEEEEEKFIRLVMNWFYEIYACREGKDDYNPMFPEITREGLPFIYVAPWSTGFLRGSYLWMDFEDMEAEAKPHFHELVMPALISTPESYEEVLGELTQEQTDDWDNFYMEQISGLHGEMITHLEELSHMWHPIEKQAPIVNDGPKIGRNDPCTCGSGKKYKKCCGKK